MSELLEHIIERFPPQVHNVRPIPESLRTPSTPPPPPPPVSSTTDTPTNETNPRTNRKCGYCRKEGHTVRHCQDIFKIKNDAKNYYKDWLIVSIKDYFICNKWTYTAEMRYAWTEVEKKMYDKVLTPQLISMYDQLRSKPVNELFQTLLTTTTEYVQNLPNEHLIVLFKQYPEIHGLFNKRDLDQLRLYIHYALVKTADISIVFREVDSMISSMKLNWNTHYIQYIENTIKIAPIFTTLFKDIFDINYMNKKDRIRRMEYIHDVFKRKLLISRRRIANTKDEINNITPTIMRYRSEIEKFERRIRDLKEQIVITQNNRSVLENRLVVFQNEHRLHNDMMPLFKNIPSCLDIEFISKESNVGSDSSVETKECAICYEDVEDSLICDLNCNHHFCIPCVAKIVVLDFKKNHNNINRRVTCTCPFCREKIETIKGKLSELYCTIETHCYDNLIDYNKIVKYVGGPNVKVSEQTET